MVDASLVAIDTQVVYMTWPRFKCESPNQYVRVIERQRNKYTILMHESHDLQCTRYEHTEHEGRKSPGLIRLHTRGFALFRWSAAQGQCTNLGHHAAWRWWKMTELFVSWSHGWKGRLVCVQECSGSILPVQSSSFHITFDGTRGTGLWVSGGLCISGNRWNVAFKSVMITNNYIDIARDKGSQTLGICCRGDKGSAGQSRTRRSLARVSDRYSS